MTTIVYGIALALGVFMVSLVALVYLSPARATAMALKATRRQAGLVRKELAMSNGLRYVYLEGGQGEPLMLLHGFGGNKDTFTPVSRLLRRRYRVIVPDIIGFGESAHPSGVDYSPSAQVDRLRAFAQALGLQNLHLGGNSMGGQIALLYAARHPTEVTSLWLLSPAGVWSAPQGDVLKTYLETGRNQLIARNETEFKKVMALGMNRPPYVPKPMLAVLARERIQNVSLEAHIFQQLLDHSIEDRIRGMETPALIVFGSRDRVIPAATADLLHNLLPNSKVVLVQNAGHVAMFEKPRQCATDYVAFRGSLANADPHFDSGEYSRNA